MILSSDHFRWIDALLKEAIIPWLIISPLTQNIFFQNFFFINSHKGWIKERNIYEFRTIFSTSNSQQKLAHMLPFLSCNVHKCLWCLKTNLNLKKKNWIAFESDFSKETTFPFLGNGHQSASIHPITLFTLNFFIIIWQKDWMRILQVFPLFHLGTNGSP